MDFDDGECPLLENILGSRNTNTAFITVRMSYDRMLAQISGFGSDSAHTWERLEEVIMPVPQIG